MPKIGVEVEGYVLERNSTNQWVPWNTPTSYCYGTGVLADPVGLVDDIMTTAAKVGIPIETVSSEYESAQFEFTIHYDDPIVAIDNTFLLKLLARERAIEHGFWRNMGVASSWWWCWHGFFPAFRHGHLLRWHRGCGPAHCQCVVE